MPRNEPRSTEKPERWWQTTWGGWLAFLAFVTLCAWPLWLAASTGFSLGVRSPN